MDCEMKEKLIEVVRKYECIYNQKHKDYKNSTYKNLLWEQIGVAIGIEGTKAKEAWRTLRDGYIRHKKQVKGQTGSSRKYSNYTWSSHLTFLDGTLELRPTGSNVRPTQAYSDPPQSSLAGRSQSPSPPPQRSPSSPPPPTQPQTPVAPQSRPSSQTQQQPSTLPSSTPRTTKKRNDSDMGLDTTDRVLDYLRNKKKREWDSVDHLFMSYAKTFKKLSLRKQGKIKVELAKMFAEAELDDLENNATTNPDLNIEPSSPVIILSPAYSIISDDSGDLSQSLLFNNSQEEVPTPTADDDTQVLDLSNLQ
ncbi:transcription factor Adf-1-like [Cydia fagiglandana]|uniref:transcription factor Adf-1-like n=1 Tax=Cydia fagiglandana TaxID=1458189 RepID=UPI002FEE56EC